MENNKKRIKKLEKRLYDVCRYCIYAVPSTSAIFDIVICHRFPTTIQKPKQDFCGEFKHG